MRILHQQPTYFEEDTLFKQGYKLVAGLDEVGRGPWAGPVVAGVVLFPPDLARDSLSMVRDSKKLSPNQRDKAMTHIENAALALSIGISTPQEIDDVGIVRATQMAMSRSIKSLSVIPQFLLLDAFPLPNVAIPQKPIIGGDASCLSIAAASIVAKVNRDLYMEHQDAIYPGYGFIRHKGYGTKEHLASLSRLGPCTIHRRTFSPLKRMFPVYQKPNA